MRNNIGSQLTYNEYLLASQKMVPKRLGDFQELVLIYELCFPAEICQWKCPALPEYLLRNNHGAPLTLVAVNLFRVIAQLIGAGRLLKFKSYVLQED